MRRRPAPPARRFPILPVLLLAALVAVGWLGGYGVGLGVGWVRDVWPDPVPPLAAAKVAAPEPADHGGPSQACPTSSLTLLATPSALHVLPGTTVSFDVSVTNSGRRPCLIDGGDTNRQLVITDAAGTTVWSSAHCATGSRDLLLGPGDVRQDTLSWNGMPSAEGQCTTGQSPVAPGVYTARLTLANIQGSTSTPVTITVETPPAPTPTPPPTTETPAPPADGTQPPDGSQAPSGQPTDGQTPAGQPTDTPPPAAQAGADLVTPDQIAD